MVDIGGGTTEIAVLSLAGAVVSTSLRVAGDDMDEAIISHLRRHHNLLIGEQSAEKIKLTLGTAWPMKEELAMEVKGRDSVSGLPRQATITSIEIREALSHPGRLICEAIRGILRRPRPRSRPTSTTAASRWSAAAPCCWACRTRVGPPGSPCARRPEPLSAARGTGIFLDKLDVFSKVLATAEVD